MTDTAEGNGVGRGRLHDGAHGASGGGGDGPVDDGLRGDGVGGGGVDGDGCLRVDERLPCR